MQIGPFYNYRYIACKQKTNLKSRVCVNAPLGIQDFFRTGEAPGFLRQFISQGVEGVRAVGSNARTRVSEQATRSGISGSELNRLLAGVDTQSELTAAGVPTNLISGLLPVKYNH